MSQSYPSSVSSTAVEIFSLRGWIMWAVVSLFYSYQFFLRVSPSVMSGELMATFAVGAGALGVLTSSYYLTYAPLQLPLGMLIDALGPRRLASGAVLMCAVGSLVFAFAQSILVAQIGRMLVGAGSGCAFLSCLKVASLWLPPRRLAIAGSFTMMLGTLGATTAGTPLALMVKNFGWRSSIAYLAIFGFGLAATLWLVLRDRSLKKLTDDALPDNQKRQSMFQGLLEVVRNPQCWLIAFYTFLMYTPMAVFGDMWGVPYIMQRFCVSCIDAAAPATLLYIGVAFGAPCFAWLSDRLKSRRKPMLFTTFAVSITFGLLLYGPQGSLLYASALIFLTGIFLGGQFLGFPVICELNRITLSATASGFNNTVCMLSGVFFQPLVGIILDWLWNGQYQETGVRCYTTASYHCGLGVIPFTTILAGILVLFIKETYHLAEDPGRQA